MEKLSLCARAMYEQFQQSSPQSQRRLVGGLVASLLVCLWLWDWHRRCTPEYAFGIIQSIETKADVARNRAYLTAQGTKVVIHLLDSQKGPTTGERLQARPAQVRGNTCYIPISQGQQAGYVEFRQDGVWKFHDLHFTRLNGRSVELSVAYSIDHPFLTSLQLTDWSSLLQSFATGFVFGMSQGSR